MGKSKIVGEHFVYWILIYIIWAAHFPIGYAFLSWIERHRYGAFCRYLSPGNFLLPVKVEKYTGIFVGASTFRMCPKARL